jgi:hypothetical protein
MSSDSEDSSESPSKAYPGRPLLSDASIAKIERIERRDRTESHEILEDRYGSASQEPVMISTKAPRPTVTSTMLKQKQELIEEVAADKRDCCSVFKVTVQYLMAGKAKKPTAFKIGIFTVFLVVMLLVMMQAVLGSFPILFVKLGQEQVGAIDFVITQSNIEMTNGNFNYYGTNPMDNPLKITRDSSTGY